MFELGNQLRDGGLGHVEAACRFPHAAGLDDGHQYVQVSQFKPAPDAIIPRHGRHPFPAVMTSSINTITNSWRLATCWRRQFWIHPPSKCKGGVIRGAPMKLLR